MTNTTNLTSLNNLNSWFNRIDDLNMNISRYGLGFIWFIGNTGSIINCLIFAQSKLRRNPCVMYFLASNALQFITFNFALFTRMLYLGYDVQVINSSVLYCRIRYYLFYIAVAVPRFYIVLASIDRYLISSPQTYRRRWSSRKVALNLIIGTFLFWCVLYIQVFFLYGIQDGSCTFYNGFYGLFFSIYLLIESGVIPPSLMLIFGLLTLRNITQSRRRTNPLSPITLTVVLPRKRSLHLSKKDLNFSKMLFNQICLMLILNLLNPVYLLYQAITINDVKSPLRLKVEAFINNFSYVLIYLELSLTFFVYTLTSAVFRRELNQLICKTLLRRPLRDNTNSSRTI